MRLAAMIICLMAVPVVSGGSWSVERLTEFMATTSRFIPDDWDQGDAEDSPERERDALPLFEDIIRESGWTTNQLVEALITVTANGFSEGGWNDPVMRKAGKVAMTQIVLINNPLVTNYLHRAVESDLHGYERDAIPGLFRYTNFEPEIMDRLRALCVKTNRYDKAASATLRDLVYGLKDLPEDIRPAAKTRVAKFLYYSLPYVSHIQSLQDDCIVELVPSYSNSVQRLRLLRAVAATCPFEYDRKDASNVVERLSAIPVGELNDIPWIESE